MARRRPPRDGEKPRRKRERGPVAMQILINLQKRFLRQILRVMPVTGELVQEIEYPVLMAQHELLERFAATGLRALRQRFGTRLRLKQRAHDAAVAALGYQRR